MGILFEEAVDKFSSENTQEEKYDFWIFQLEKCLCGKWYGATLEDSDSILREFIYLRVLKKRKLNCESVKTLEEFIVLFKDFISDEYGFEITLNIDDVLYELERVGQINTEFDRFLNNPVISYNPLVIDMDRYKKRSVKKSITNKGVTCEKGYFVVMDVFANNSIVLKKLYTGRFVRLVVDKELVGLVRSNDIIYMSIRQNFFLGWDIDEVIKFYPKEASEYLIRTGV